MNKRELKSNVKEAYSSKEKRRMVEEIRSGLLSLRQSTQQHHVSVSVLQKWNRWYFKTRLLQYYRPQSSSLMTLNQLKRQLQAAQAQLAPLQLQNTALETMIKVAEKQLKIDIRKKKRSKN